MKVRDLLNESDVGNNPLPKDKKDKLRDVLSSIFSVIERYERGDSIDDKDSKEKIEMLKDTVNSMIQSEDRKKVIKGDG